MKFLAVALLGVLVFSANAEDDTSQAPQSVISEAKSLCEHYAKEDQVASEDLADYVLACVNDELTEQGYSKVDNVD